ncbi:MAG: penicillin-binding protein 1B [Kangiellaceae bacterium]|nr:penicillin-binding protein 1B [Kangiellaceae bacterium]
MAAQRKKKATKAKSSKHRVKKRYIVLKWMFKLSAVFLAVVCVWLVYLDAVIQKQFEGRRWELPAHVYSAPTLLYVGAPMTASQLVDLLDTLGYRKVYQVNAPGEYRRQGQVVEFYARAFDFFDGKRDARQLRLGFDNAYITSIQDSNRRNINTFRIEPLRIGGIYPTKNEDRLLIQLEDVPPVLVDALIASEDRDFYTHFGVSPKGIARALWVNLTSGKARQGGSTITQQLVKNYFLTSERTLWRKIREAAMSVLLEIHYSKNEILEAYLNEVYLGQDGQRSINGFGLASFHYFGRPVSELTEEQCATLVALVRGPSYYNPFRHADRARERRNLMLKHLYEGGFVSEAIYANAIKTPLSVTRQGRRQQNLYPAFLELVKTHLRQDYSGDDLRNEGLRIFTTLDVAVQQQSEAKLVQRLGQLEQQKGIPKDTLQAAVVVTNPDNGEILAVVGDRHVREQGFNRALQARRPVGSLIKPVIYLTALLQPQDYHPASMIADEPFTMTSTDGSEWTPLNYDKQAHGDVWLMEGLTQSYNLATVRLGMDIGMERINQTLKQLGIEQPMTYPSAMLGAYEMSPLEVTQMYQQFASGGFSVPLQSVTAVTDREGALIQRYPLQVNNQVDENAVYQVNYMLNQASMIGTSRSISQRMPHLAAAGKTGTTDDLRDSWFAGFTGDRLAVVWIGRDDNQSSKLTGASGALQLWIDIMSDVSFWSYEPNMPSGVVLTAVNDQGMPVEEGCPAVASIPMQRQFVPEQRGECKKSNKVMRWLKRVFQ